MSNDVSDLTETQRQRYTKLFTKLDSNKDGRIDVYDLVQAFQQYSLASHCPENNLNRARQFITKNDKNLSGDVTFDEFMQGMKDHEQRLDTVFKGIDTDNDNKIDKQELVNFFQKFDKKLTEAEANDLLEKINRNKKTAQIQPNEWKNYFLLTPIDDIDDLLYHWQHSTLIDIGDSFALSTFPEDFTRRNIWWTNFVSGAVAGAISRTCTAPFDRLKTVMQVLGSRKHITILGGFNHMLNEGGPLSLWRGNGMNVIKIAPEAALRFMFYEEIKTLLRNDENREPTVFERFISGSMAGGAAQSIIYPLEVLKTRLVLRKTGEFDSIFDCFKKIYTREGLTAFYKGFVPNLLGIIPYAGVDLASYETLKHFYMKHKMVDNPSVPILFLCGTTSTICGQLISYPLTLVRTRLQAQEIPMNSADRDTMTKLLSNIWKNEGVRGLYRGLLPNIIKVVPAVSLSYVVYENMKRMLLLPRKIDEEN